MLGEFGDSKAWLSACSSFPNGVPRFPCRSAALKFMVDYNHRNCGSNPKDPTLKHIFTTLTDWEQVCGILIPEIEKAREEKSVNEFNEKFGNNNNDHDDNNDSKNDSNSNNDNNSNNDSSGSSDNNDKSDKNVFSKSAVSSGIATRLDLPFHRSTSPVSTMNTLKYLFFHMKCGIFVMFRNGKLRVFCPFVNKHYRNRWGDAIRIEGDDSLEKYYTMKGNCGAGRQEDIDPDRFAWWANGNIICNEHAVPGKVR